MNIILKIMFCVYIFILGAAIDNIFIADPKIERIEHKKLDAFDTAYEYCINLNPVQKAANCLIEVHAVCEKYQ